MAVNNAIIRTRVRVQYPENNNRVPACFCGGSDSSAGRDCDLDAAVGIRGLSATGMFWSQEFKSLVVAKILPLGPGMRCTGSFKLRSHLWTVRIDTWKYPAISFQELS